jgi:hypothetical protein
MGNCNKGIVSFDTHVSLFAISPKAKLADMGKGPHDIYSSQHLDHQSYV